MPNNIRKYVTQFQVGPRSKINKGAVYCWPVGSWYFSRYFFHCKVIYHYMEQNHFSFVHE